MAYGDIIILLIGFSYVDLVNREGHNYALVSETVFFGYSLCALSSECPTIHPRYISLG